MSKKNTSFDKCFSFLFFLSFQKKAVGQHLMEQVFYKLDIVEKDYFGLQYTDAHNVPHWLDPTKPVKKQVKSKLQKHNINSVYKETLEKISNNHILILTYQYFIVGPPYTFRMRIKFYSSEPNNLREEITR